VNSLNIISKEYFSSGVLHTSNIYLSQPISCMNERFINCAQPGNKPKYSTGK